MTAAHIYALDHPQLARTLAAKMEKERGQLLENLMLAQDWGDYCARRGAINGLDVAIAMCNETVKEERE